MNKWYFGVPIVALVAFYAYFVQFDKKDEAKMREKERIAEEAKKTKLEEERQARLKAVEEAKAMIEQRKAEQAEKKKAKEAADAKREDERLALERAKTENSQLKVELKDVREEVEKEERLLKLALEQKKNYEAERDFVLSYNDTARQNKDRFLKIIDKIDEAEKKRAELAAAAAAKK